MNDQLAHVGFVVRDIDREVRRWVDAGAQVFIEPERDPAQKVICALLGFPATSPFELVAPDGEGSPVAARVNRGGGLDHVCYFTNDIDGSFVEFQTRGGYPLVAPIYGVVFDREIAFLQFRTGLIVELMKFEREGRKALDPLESYFTAIKVGVR